MGTLSPSEEAHSGHGSQYSGQHREEYAAVAGLHRFSFCRRGDRRYGCLLYTSQCLRDLTVAIPNEMALISYDEHSWSKLMTVPLSTIKQPAVELGANAARIVLDRIKNPQKAYETVVLQSELILRDSI